jgi:hypothetical protein
MFDNWAGSVTANDCRATYGFPSRTEFKAKDGKRKDLKLIVKLINHVDPGSEVRIPGLAKYLHEGPLPHGE